MSGTLIVPAADARLLAADVLVAHGSPEAAAERQARHLIEADLRDQASHGLQRLPVLVGRMNNDLLRGDAEPRGEWLTPAVLRVDGDRGMGPVIADWCIDQLLERAAVQGVAVALLSNTNHLGILAPFVERMADRRAVGIALTTSEALVHPYGGVGALVGTNPIAIGVPAAEPVSLDMATGAVSMGKILAYARQQRALEPGWAVDEIGDPTTDAERARSGAISPFGGAKGYALGVTLEVLIALLTATAYGTDVRGTLDTTSICSKGDVFLCLDLGALGLGDPTAAERYLAEVRGAGRGQGRPVDIPGDRARRSRTERLAAGIPYPHDTWAAARDLLPAGEPGARR